MRVGGAVGADRLCFPTKEEFSVGVTVRWTIRESESEDHEAILGVVRMAFTDPDRDGQEEVDIVRDTWTLGAGIDGLELVADVQGRVVGHVLAARGELGGEVVAAVAPLSVAPSWQHRGVGSDLMGALLGRAEDQGWPLVVLLGDPGYYGRFGFETSWPLGIVYPPVGGGSPHFLARRMPTFRPSLRGEFRYCWEAHPPGLAPGRRDR